MEKEEGECNEFVLAKLQMLYDIYASYVKDITSLRNIIQEIFTAIAILSFIFTILVDFAKLYQPPPLSNDAIEFITDAVAVMGISFIIALMLVEHSRSLLLSKIAEKILLIEEKCLPEHARCLFSLRGLIRMESYSLCSVEDLKREGWRDRLSRWFSSFFQAF